MKRHGQRRFKPVVVRSVLPAEKLMAAVPKLTQSSSGVVNFQSSTTDVNNTSQDAMNMELNRLSKAIPSTSERKSWTDVKLELQQGLLRKRHDHLKQRYELWNCDEEQRAMMEEKVLQPFVAAEETSDIEIEELPQDDEETVDVILNSQESEKRSPLRLDLRIEPVDLTEESSNETVDDYQPIRLDLHIEPESASVAANDAIDKTLELAPVNYVSDSEEEDMNEEYPTLHISSVLDKPSDSLSANNSIADESQLSVTGLLVPSASTQDRAISKLFFDDSRNEDFDAEQSYTGKQYPVELLNADVANPTSSSAEVPIEDEAQRFFSDSFSSTKRTSKGADKNENGLGFDIQSTNDCREQLEDLCSAPFGNQSESLDENARDAFPPPTRRVDPLFVQSDLYDPEDEEDSSTEKRSISHKDKANYAAKARQFFDTEAELSGDDDSGDEEEDGLENDAYEEEDHSDAEEIADDEELRAQIGQIHFKQMLDEDDRVVQMYKENLLENRQQRSGVLQRRLGWSTVRDVPDDILNTLSDNDDQDEEEVEDENVKKWQMARQEKAQWMIELPDESLSDQLNSSFNIVSEVKESVKSEECQLLRSTYVKKAAINFSDENIVMVSSSFEHHANESLLRRDQEALELALMSNDNGSTIDYSKCSFVRAGITEEDDLTTESLMQNTIKKKRKMSKEMGTTVFKFIKH